ncbi:hypothetical protein V1511DRAFT_499570 [Dipodascopsis uninucleata]
MSESRNLGICKRCRKHDAVTVSRKEAFCRDCFVRFLRGKQRKQMSSYKVIYDAPGSVNAQAPKVLLALSLSESSLSLFEMLLSLLHEQRVMHRGRVGFHLVVAHIDLSSIYEYPEPPAETILRIDTKFDIQIHNIPIDNFFGNNDNIQWFSNSFSSDSHYGFDDSVALDVPTSVKDLLSRIRERTSKLDILSTIIGRLIESTAMENNCSTILWGDSMTRLAEKVLSMTTKGRGFTLPYELSDNAKNGIYHIYPLREVLREETVDYCALTNIGNLVLKSKVVTPSILRMMTIDDLLGNYFSDISKDFPSVVSTVVKTADKLADNHSDNAVFCTICDKPCDDYDGMNPSKWLDLITSNEAASSSLVSSQHDNAVKIEDSIESRHSVPLCYGCLVSTKDSKFPWVAKRHFTKEDILNEFELKD